VDTHEYSKKWKERKGKRGKKKGNNRGASKVGGDRTRAKTKRNIIGIDLAIYFQKEGKRKGESFPLPGPPSRQVIVSGPSQKTKEGTSAMEKGRKAAVEKVRTARSQRRKRGGKENRIPHSRRNREFFRGGDFPLSGGVPGSGGSGEKEVFPLFSGRGEARPSRAKEKEKEKESPEVARKKEGDNINRLISVISGRKKKGKKGNCRLQKKGDVGFDCSVWAAKGAGKKKDRLGCSTRKVFSTDGSTDFRGQKEKRDVHPWNA